MSKRPADGKGGDHPDTKKQKSDESTASAAAAAANPPPPAANLLASIDRISKLPNDLLSIILTFLPLKDLQSAVTVSKRLHQAVGDSKTKPADGISNAAQLQKLATTTHVRSALSRHVSRYGTRTEATEAPWLTPLHLTPPQLHRLLLMSPHLKELAVRAPICNETNELILVVCTMRHSLVDFRLILGSGVQGSLVSNINFHPLRVRSESDGQSKLEFYLELPGKDTYVDHEMTVEQINDLRAIKQNRLPCSITRNPTLARRLLQEPHEGWTSLSKLEENGELEEKNVDLLLKLTNLNQLAFKFGGGPFYDDSTFLPDLINLTDVTIWMNDKYSSIIIDILMGSLQHLHKLTRLSITGSQHLSSDHLTHLLLQLPSLETLQLHNCPNVPSLAFLTSSTSIIRVHIYRGHTHLVAADQVQYLQHLPPKLTELHLHFRTDAAKFFDAAVWQPIVIAFQGLKILFLL